MSRDEIIEECAKTVDEVIWTLPIYASSVNVNVATGECATIVVRQAASAIRALKTAQGTGKEP